MGTVTPEDITILSIKIKIANFSVLNFTQKNVLVDLELQNNINSRITGGFQCHTFSNRQVI